MYTEPDLMSASDFGLDNIELLKRQLAERGFYIIGRLPPERGKPAHLETSTRPDPSLARRH